jgi:hypothetical protein
MLGAPQWRWLDAKAQATEPDIRAELEKLA